MRLGPTDDDPPCSSTTQFRKNLFAPSSAHVKVATGTIPGRETHRDRGRRDGKHSDAARDDARVKALPGETSRGFLSYNKFFFFSSSRGRDLPAREQRSRFFFFFFGRGRDAPRNCWRDDLMMSKRW